MWTTALSLVLAGILPGVKALEAWAPFVTTEYLGWVSTSTVWTDFPPIETETYKQTYTLTALPSGATITSSFVIDWKTLPITSSLFYIDGLENIPKPWPTLTTASPYTATYYHKITVATQPAYCTGSLSTSWASTKTGTAFSLHTGLAAQITPISTSSRGTTVDIYVNEKDYPGSRAPTPTITNAPDDPFNEGIARRKCEAPTMTDTSTATRNDFLESISSRYPDLYATPTQRSSYISRYSDQCYRCSRWGGCEWTYDCDRSWNRYKKYVIIVIVVWVSVFLLGFVESFFHFKRMMNGDSGLRLGTITWVFISLWAICLIRRAKKVRDEEERKRLQEYWKGLSGGAKFKLWLKWGFRWKYPAFLWDVRQPAGSGRVVMGAMGSVGGSEAEMVAKPQPAVTGEHGYYNPPAHTEGNAPAAGGNGGARP